MIAGNDYNSVADNRMGWNGGGVQSLIAMHGEHIYAWSAQVWQTAVYVSFHHVTFQCIVQLYSSSFESLCMLTPL